MLQKKLNNRIKDTNNILYRLQALDIPNINKNLFEYLYDEINMVVRNRTSHIMWSVVADITKD